MASRIDDKQAKPKPAPRNREDVEILLFGLLQLGLGTVGLASGHAIIVVPGDPIASPLSGVVSGPGGRIVAVGLLTVGIACVGRWHRRALARWHLRCGLAGAGFMAVGLLIEGIGRLQL
jgi:hypothetical protein